MAVRYDKGQAPSERAAAKLPYLRLIRFTSSWKVFFSLLIPSIIADFLFFKGEANFFFWFLILYGFFILSLSAAHHLPLFKSLDTFNVAGKRRLESYEIQDEERMRKQEKIDHIRYLLILAAIAAVFAYGLLAGKISL